MDSFPKYSHILITLNLVFKISMCIIFMRLIFMDLASHENLLLSRFTVWGAYVYIIKMYPSKIVPY